MQLEQIARALSNTESYCDGNVNGVQIDSRLITPSQLFIALEGENCDGHSYINEAKNNGAIAAIVSKDVSSDLPIIKVNDTIEALATLGKLYRDKFLGTVIAITGSTGKTTVKEMVATILNESGNVLSTRGNYNNHIGVPLTLTMLNDSHDYAVIELGANHAGEIKYTSQIAQPHIAIINNISEAHIAEFGDLNTIINTKCFNNACFMI